MVLFALYAALIWYFAQRWRRRWRGYGVVLLGVIGIWLVINLFSGGKTFFGLGGHGIMFLLYAELIAVGLVGLFLASLPIRRKPTDCRYCGYDLVGLDSQTNTIICPECGRPNTLPPPQKPVERIPIPRTRTKNHHRI